jgi:hypothetical protein
MDRERIEHLLKMAHELEVLEASAGDAEAIRNLEMASLEEVPLPFSFAEAAARREQERKDAEYSSGRIWRRIVNTAAVLLLGGIAWSVVQPLVAGPIVRHTPVVIVPRQPGKIDNGVSTRVVAAGYSPAAVAECVPVQAGIVAGIEGFASRIISFALDSESGCRCSQTVIHEWDDRPVGSVTRAELLRIGYESACISDPDRILVVAISGPVGDLPDSDDALLAVASCVDLPSNDDDIGYLGHDEAKYTAAAMSCLARGLKVETATLMTR